MLRKFCSKKLRPYIEAVINALLMLSCLYTYTESPNVMCELNWSRSCHSSMSITMISMFPRAVAAGCMISRLAVLYKSRRAVFKYRNKIEEYEVYFPTGAGKTKTGRNFIAVIVSFCAVIILPINASRLYLIYRHIGKIDVVVFIALMYAQNLSTCATEMRFVSCCFGLNQKFQSINEEMSAIRSKTIVANRYPLVLKFDDRSGKRVNVISSAFPSRKTKGGSLGDAVELLKMRHQFVCDAVTDLNDLYGVQLGSSLCVLFIMILFDIYQNVFKHNANINTKKDFLLLGWMIQYTFRLCVILQTAHVTSKQAYKTKSLVADINNRYLDQNTKEELRLFLNELSCRSVDFTTLDFFILNTRLITSTIVAGTTYLVVLLQFQ